MTNKSLGTLTVDMVLETAGFETGMDKAERIADQKTRKIEQQARERARSIEMAWRSMASSIAAPLAGVASIAGLTTLIKGVADVGDELAKMTTRTGIATAELSKLKYAASLSDVSSADLASSLTKLNKIMGEAAGGSKEAQAALARFGIAPNTTNALEAFGNIAERVKNTGDETKIASALNDVFGKSYATLIPLLKGGADGLRDAGDELERMGGVMSGDVASAAEQLNDNFTRLSAQLEALRVNVVAPVLPLLVELSGSMVDTAQSADTLAGSGSALKTIFETVAVVGVNTKYVVSQIGAEIEGMSKQLKALSTLDFDAFSAIGEAMKEDAKQARIDIDALSYRLMNPYRDDGYKDRWMTPAPTGAGIVGTPPKITTTTTTKAISDGQRLIDQLRQRLAATQNLTEVEKLQSMLEESRFAKMAPGERTIALALAEQIDRRTEIARQLDEEIAAARELSQVYDQQAARLQQMIAQTPAGQALSRMQDEALIESAYMSGQIDTSTYDQLIAKLHEVKDEGKDAFADLQSAIEGWGKASADAFVEFAFTGKTSFADMTTSILKDLAKMAVYQNVTKPMADGIGEWIKGLLPSANGNVFSEAPGLHRYVNTVQTSPKVFGYGQLHGFANGGVFAEAGPEAVMPLARDTQGRLGVRAQGGGTNVEINLTVHESGATTGNSTGDTTDAWRQFATRIKGMILDEMTTQKRPGGMLYS
jgi:lambda family phage tail tape measure protein